MGYVPYQVLYTITKISNVHSTELFLLTEESSWQTIIWTLLCLVPTPTLCCALALSAGPEFPDDHLAPPWGPIFSSMKQKERLLRSPHPFSRELDTGEKKNKTSPPPLPPAQGQTLSSLAPALALCPRVTSESHLHALKPLTLWTSSCSCSQGVLLGRFKKWPMTGQP